MKKAIHCALITAAIGFTVAVWVFTVSPQSAPRWVSTTLAPYILCPPGILAVLSMSDPDPESIWLLFAPHNAAIYGGMGFTLWLFFMGDDEYSATSKKDPVTSATVP
ncbi:MAG: hypothetical protein ACLPLR_04560 [Terriglobales bacterium]|jgi:hypothetical protein